ncbi:MAG TPA: hypothetical protein VIH35_00170, partial [Kiritimatiellia bacterium]
MGSELWGPYLPQYMRAGLGAPILLIALYGSFRDFLEAINYSVGGWLAGRMNTRRSLLLFNALPLAGLLILLVGQSAVAVFVALPLVFVWDSLAGPALLTVVGDSLPSERRAMAVSMQSLFRRLSRIVAYSVNAACVLWAGTELGMRAAFLLSIAVVLASLVIQFRYMKTATRDAGTILHRPLVVLRGFDPQLKRLLAADILARWAEGTPREFVILFVIGILSGARGLGDSAAWAAYGGLMIVSQVTSALTYLPMGAVASRPGLAKRPYIGWTFFFFATYPLVLALAGYFALRGNAPQGLVLPLLAFAFVFSGLREIGEPARKAMIIDLVPPEAKSQAIGLYWSTRCVAVMLAPLVGGAIWIAANVATGHAAGDASGPGPFAVLGASGLFGVAGVCFYYARFGR